MAKTNTQPACIKAKRPSKKRSARVVHPELLPDTNASSSELYHSPPKDAKSACITKLSPPDRRELALFIVRKFMLAERLVYRRDMPIAYKLADRHPAIGFWRVVPLKRQMEALVMMWTPKARTYLTRLWSDYQKSLQRMRSISVEKPSPHFTIGPDKIGEDYIPAARRPRSLAEFCK